MDEDTIRRIVQEELANLNHNDKPKKKKAPSKWNIFLGKCTKEQPKEMTLGEKAKACSIEYKKVKDKLDIEKIEKQLTEEIE